MAGAGFPGAGYMPLSMRVGAPGGFAPAYDAFADSIVHAYEPARRVLSSYTGNLVRLRRASDNAEANFTYLANGDLDVAAIAAWAGGASYVVTVYDQAPNSDDVTQAVAANQPLYVASIRNGHAGMLFDGTNDYLQGAFTTGGILSQPVNIYAVAQLDATAVNDDVLHYMVDGDDSTNRMGLGQVPPPSPNPWEMWAGTELSGSLSTANWTVWSSLFNGVASQFWVNSVSAASGNAGANNLDGLVVGAAYLVNLALWKGPIVSIVICDPSLSDALRIAMQNATNAYWSCF